MTIRWINNNLGAAPASSAYSEPGVVVLDVRDLVDKGGNNPEQVLQKITEGSELINTGKRLLVCCDLGISRSNAIAAGIMAKLGGTTVDKAVRDIIAATGEAEIKIELLDIARLVVEGSADQTVQAATGDRVLLTGAHGSLGRAVAAQFKQMGIEPVTPSSRDLDLVKGRAELNMLIRSEGIGSVVHLDNPGVYTSNFALGETLVMLRNVLEVCSRNDVWMLYPSSWEVYSGYPTSSLSADETLPLRATGPYGETKLLCETLINNFRRIEGLECALIRPAMVYGPGSDRPKFIHTFMEKARRGEPIMTHSYANAEPALDLLHIDDFARAITKTITARFVGDLNIGTGRLTTTRQIAEWVVRWLKSRSTIESVKIAHDVANIKIDCRKAGHKIDWHARIPIDVGLRALVQRSCGD